MSQSPEQTTLWHEFARSYNLSTLQVEQFQLYYKMLIEANELFNITTITELRHVIYDHFEDSLALATAHDLSKEQMLVDVGTGGGFPAIPLKIAYPHLKMVLIEVTAKKILFLQSIIQKINLQNMQIYEFDWRTFLRQTTYPATLFISRAALAPHELVRMFKSSSPYKNSMLVYWASQKWKLSHDENYYFFKEHAYRIENKQRRLIFFKIKES